MGWGCLVYEYSFLLAPAALWDTEISCIAFHISSAAAHCLGRPKIWVLIQNQIGEPAEAIYPLPIFHPCHYHDSFAWFLLQRIAQLMPLDECCCSVALSMSSISVRETDAAAAFTSLVGLVREAKLH